MKIWVWGKYGLREDSVSHRHQAGGDPLMQVQFTPTYNETGKSLHLQEGNKPST